MDSQWWKCYGDSAFAKFRGELYTTSHQVKGVRIIEKRDAENHGNSGVAAISIAAWFGASRIIMIGYDCKKTPKAHWHGDHPKGLGNAGSVLQWPAKFKKLADRMNGIEIINCTPGTALKCFPTGELEACLETNQGGNGARRRAVSAERRQAPGREGAKPGGLHGMA